MSYLLEKLIQFVLMYTNRLSLWTTTFRRELQTSKCFQNYTWTFAVLKASIRYISKRKSITHINIGHDTIIMFNTDISTLEQPSNTNNDRLSHYEIQQTILHLLATYVLLLKYELINNQMQIKCYKRHSRGVDWVSWRVLIPARQVSYANLSSLNNRV